MKMCIVDVAVVKLERPEKIGLVELVEVKSSGRRTYVNLKGVDVKTFDIRPGDRLKIRILEIFRALREANDKSSEKPIIRQKPGGRKP